MAISELAKRLRRHDWNWSYRETRMRVLTKDLVGYKRVKTEQANFSWKEKRYTIALLIPKGTIVHCSGSRRKCRARMAVVLDDYQVGPTKSLRQWSDAIIYKQGKVVRPDRPFSLNLEECASGIHFFWEAREAQRYNMN